VANARFLYPNLVHVSGVAITTDAADPLRPASYLSSPWRKKKWRSTTDTSSHRITIDFGSAQSFQAAFLVDAKLHTGGKLWVQTRSASSVFGAPPADNALQLPSVSARSKLSGLYFGSVQSFRYVSFYFENTGAVSEYVEAAVPFVAPYTSPTVNIRDDVKFTRVDPSRITASPDGQRQILSYSQYALFDGAFSEVSTADADLLVTVHATVGISAPIILAVDPADLEQSAFGFLMEAIEKQLISGSINRWVVPVHFEEAR
jgi:hypothetical protein